MARPATRKPAKRPKPAAKSTKKKPPAKRAKILPVVPSPPQSESPPSLNSDNSPLQKPDSTGSENAVVPVQPQCPDFVIIEELLIHEDTFESEKTIPCHCKLPPNPPSDYRGCGENCLNRLSKFECGSRCPSGSYCSNKMFQQKKYAPVEAFFCGPEKGWGVRATGDIQQGDFIMEYVGELIGDLEYYRRRWLYDQDKNHRHHYFMMAVQGDVIDATKYGSISRFINHSCNPNCETVKWVVKKRSRIGFFATKLIRKGEEIVFNYQFRSSGEPQKCYCGAPNCMGFIGSKAPRVERVENDSESDVDFAELSPTKIVQGRIMRCEKEKPKKKKLVKRAKGESTKRRTDPPRLQEVTPGEMDDFVENESQLRNGDHVMNAVNLMLRLEDISDRIRFLDALLEKNNSVSNMWRLFLDNEVISILILWYHPKLTEDSEYLLKLSTFASLLPLSQQTQLKESGLLDRISKILEEPANIVRDVMEDMLTDLCVDGRKPSQERASRLKTAELFNKWSSLKVFSKIPKKERTESKLDEDKKPAYEMKSILRSSYADDRQDRTGHPQLEAHRKRSRNFFEDKWRERNNNSEKPEGGSSDEDLPKRRSVVGYVSFPTLDLMKPPQRYHEPTNMAYKDNRQLAVEEQVESVSPTPLHPVGPRTPVSDPPLTDVSPIAASVDSSVSRRKSRFDVAQKRCGEPLPAPALLTFGQPPVKPADSSFFSNVSSSQNQVPPVVFQQTMLHPPLPLPNLALMNLEVARNHLKVYQQYVSCLKTFIEQQEAVMQREPSKNLDTRLSEFAQDVENLEEALSQQESTTTTADEVQSNVASSSTQETSSPKYSTSNAVSCSIADTSGSLEKRARFKADLVKYVQSLLHSKRKSKCFKSDEEFKALVRKLTHTVLEKEEKHNHDLRVTDSVRKKTKDYVLSHMKKHYRLPKEKEPH
ncbi:hypothetical protein L596_007236 [Steinernema carpocapsae]|uniref:[histone H3]-lysine(36) N-trimethyltransferase n=1 Tax=Steinernema carpocapsae TaxID=34508 RepID=A0A4U5P9P0_STECR|nr:hypothetical protein L596_007236 [Steinernema carpocapsae]